MSQPFVDKLYTGIKGFDHIAAGGLPLNRTTLVSGTAGSGKTVFAVQFLAKGIMERDECGVFVTFEETPEDIRRNMYSFGWDIKKWEEEGKWTFVDASPVPNQDRIITGEYDLGALLARIEHATKKVHAKRISLDSLGSIFTQLNDATIVRNELFKISRSLKFLGVTALLTSERIQEYGDIARYGVEEFVADNVIIFRNNLEEEKRRRTIEILKFRGTVHQKGEFPFTVIPDEGIVVIPLSAMELKQSSTYTRIFSGNETLDKMCGGGFFRDSIILVSGATGTGKTLLATEFINGGYHNGEKSLLFAFEESREQLYRNSIGWGIDFKQMEDEGRLRVVCQYPESASLEDHLIQIKDAIEEYKPDRIVIDSLSAMERGTSIKSFREFVIGLTAFIKHHELAGIFTATTPSLVGGPSITEANISTITDSIILLRYVEMFGEMRRGITVLKMRGSMHDKEIREFCINNNGMAIGSTFKNVTGIISGNPVYLNTNETQRIEDLFKDEL